MRAGDSVCFDSSRPHLYFNHTDAVTQGIWVVVGRPRTAPADPGDPAVVRTAVEALGALESLDRGREVGGR